MIAALVVGVWTALYLGLRAGVIAAAAIAAAMLAVQLIPIPGVSIAVYLLIIAWCAALYFVFPRLMKPGARPGSGLNSQTVSFFAAQARGAWDRAKKMLQR
jgi:hypothetical protein